MLRNYIREFILCSVFILVIFIIGFHRDVQAKPVERTETNKMVLGTGKDAITEFVEVESKVCEADGHIKYKLNDNRELVFEDNRIILYKFADDDSEWFDIIGVFTDGYIYSINDF